MPALKAYTLGRFGMPGPQVIAALGLNHWIRQVDIIAVERTKKAAHALLESRGQSIPFGSEDFRVAMGDTVDALRAGGLFDEPDVYATPGTGAGGTVYPVVRIRKDGFPEHVGVLRSTYGSTVFSREVPA